MAAVPSTGALRISTLAATYGGSGTRRLGANYQRGRPGSYVHGNSADNPSVNHSAGADGYPGRCRLSSFRGQDIGYTYTNSAVLVSGAAPLTYHHSHYFFGAEYFNTTWPKKLINNSYFRAQNTNYYALVIYGGQGGTFDFINNGEVQAAGGASASAVGQHALYIYNTTAANKPRITNNGAIRGGGGAGGYGGTGGTGGMGYYDTPRTVQEGPTYSNDYHFDNDPGFNKSRAVWAAVDVSGWISGQVASLVSGAYTYFRDTYVSTVSGINIYRVYRQTTVYDRTYTNGGGGGGGGAGGRGQGGDGAAAGGAGGAPGAAGGTNAGAGGYGGNGGTGGTWGTDGAYGATGAGGGYGNWSGWGAGGSGGAAGGGGGDGIYAATPWSLLVGGTINGSYERGVQPT